MSGQSDAFETWRRRRLAEGQAVTLIDLYRLVASTRGLAPHELPITERNALRRLALPVMWPGFEEPPQTEREEVEPVQIAPYDPGWPAAFESWRAKLVGTLGGTAVRVEHVGSTAVPGLAAKAVIDVQVSVVDLARERNYVPGIEGLGVQLRSRDDVHRFFRPFSGRPRDVHVHVCAAGGEWERRHLLFRDFLRSSPEARSSYLAGKLEAAEAWRDDRVAYADAKTEVITRLMDQARSWALETGWRL